MVVWFYFWYNEIYLYMLFQPGIALMRTNVINHLNRVPEHNCWLFPCYTEQNVNEWERFSAYLVLHRTKCKPMHFEWERFSDITLTLTLNPNPNPMQDALVYISFCVTRKKSDNLCDTIHRWITFVRMRMIWRDIALVILTYRQPFYGSTFVYKSNIYFLFFYFIFYDINHVLCS